MSILKSLNQKQKEAIGLLQIGTFLEYFDLMLYVHMAVLLNELFFPPTDPKSASLIAAFAFCSTFVLRPFGALIFGYIGDNMGRKTTVIITTMMMSISCIVMASLPTYEQIGITAAWVVTTCRIFQGLSSMGEIMSAQVYMTEITKPPLQYPIVSFIGVASSVGAFCALGVASLVTQVGFNWRIAFWIGAAIAVVGSIARTRLRETPEFIAKINKQKLKKVNKSLDGSQESDTHQTSVKTLFAIFSIYCGWPITFYIAYMYFNPLLKQSFGYSSADVIFHNFLVSAVSVFTGIMIILLSLRFFPLTIMRIRSLCFLILVLVLPFLISQATSHYHIFAIQTAILCCSLGDLPGVAIFIKHIPTLKRVTATSFIYAASRAIMYIITSFGLVYLSSKLDYYGLWIITIPVCLSYLWGISHFKKLEQMNEKMPGADYIFGKRYIGGLGRVDKANNA